MGGWANDDGRVNYPMRLSFNTGVCWKKLADWPAVRDSRHKQADIPGEWQYPRRLGMSSHLRRPSGAGVDTDPQSRSSLCCFSPWYRSDIEQGAAVLDHAVSALQRIPSGGSSRLRQGDPERTESRGHGPGIARRGLLTKRHHRPIGTAPSGVGQASHGRGLFQNSRWDPHGAGTNTSRCKTSIICRPRLACHLRNPPPCSGLAVLPARRAAGCGRAYYVTSGWRALLLLLFSAPCFF